MLLTGGQTIQSNAAKTQTLMRTQTYTGTAAADLKLLANQWLPISQRLILFSSVTTGPRDSLIPVPAEAGSQWRLHISPPASGQQLPGWRPAPEPRCMLPFRISLSVCALINGILQDSRGRYLAVSEWKPCHCSSLFNALHDFRIQLDIQHLNWHEN